MLTLCITLLLTAEPDRFLGGAAPTALSAPGPVDATPTGQACSTVTLRRSSACFFDGRPVVKDTDSARKNQAKDNIELAKSLGRGLCTERLDPTLADPREKQRRLSLCTEGTQRAAGACSLAGQEALLDAEGRFSKQSRACYEALAAALQSAEVPVVPPESTPPSPRARP